MYKNFNIKYFDPRSKPIYFCAATLSRSLLMQNSVTTLFFQKNFLFGSFSEYMQKKTDTPKYRTE